MGPRSLEARSTLALFSGSPRMEVVGPKPSCTVSRAAPTGLIRMLALYRTHKEIFMVRPSSAVAWDLAPDFAAPFSSCRHREVLGRKLFSIALAVRTGLTPPV